MGLHLLVECQGKDPCTPRKNFNLVRINHFVTWISRPFSQNSYILANDDTSLISRITENIKNYENKGKFLCFSSYPFVERIPPTHSDQISLEELPEKSNFDLTLGWGWVIMCWLAPSQSWWTSTRQVHEFMTCIHMLPWSSFYDTFNQTKRIQQPLLVATPQNKNKETEPNFALKGF